MFCSKCGKTIRETDQVCPGCGAAIGDSRFGGLPYTSVQFSVDPGQAEAGKLSNGPVKNYTRTTYTGNGDIAEEDSDVGSRTTYRPVYEGASAPENVRRDMRAAMAPETQEEEEKQQEEEPADLNGMPLSDTAREALDELDEDLRPDEKVDMSEFRPREIKSSGRAGISRDVSEYIRKLEDGSSRRASRRRAAYEAEEEERAPYAEPEYTEEDYADDDYRDDYADDYPDDYGDDDYSDARASRRGRIDLRRFIKPAIIVAVAAVLIVGIVLGLKFVGSRSSSSPIEGVSESLYTQGIEMIKAHTQQDYIDSYTALYTSDGMLALSNALTADSQAIAALLPDEPATNDETFVSALQAIQDNIGNAILMDAMAVDSTSDTKQADSRARWQIVTNAITQLEGITSAAELTGIINGQVITVASETAAPAATAEPVVYRSLQKGDESNDVMKLQQRLKDLGYLSDAADGSFGSKTSTAVKLFQETAGISATGIADNDTQTLLYSDDAPYAPGATTPTPSAAPTDTPAPTEQAIQPAEVADTSNTDPLAADSQV